MEIVICIVESNDIAINGMEMGLSMHEWEVLCDLVLLYTDRTEKGIIL